MTNWMRRLFGRTAPTPNRPPDLRKVAADASRWVQCGVCGYNCPVGIDVRSYARRGLIVDDPTCLTCGNCIDVCPRGTLRWETQGIIDRYLAQEPALA